MNQSVNTRKTSHTGGICDNGFGLNKGLQTLETVPTSVCEIDILTMCVFSLFTNVSYWINVSESESYFALTGELWSVFVPGFSRKLTALKQHRTVYWHAFRILLSLSMWCAACQMNLYAWGLLHWDKGTCPTGNVATSNNKIVYPLWFGNTTVTKGHTNRRCDSTWYVLRRCLGWVLLSQFLPFRYFSNFSALSKHILTMEYHVYICQVSPQLSCGGTCQI